MENRTIYEVVRDSAVRFASRTVVEYRKSGKPFSLTYEELWKSVMGLRRGFAQLGLSKGDRCAILSENRVEWAITDLACQCLGVITVPIYPTLPTEQVVQLLNDSGSIILVVSDAKQFAKIKDYKDACPTIKELVVIDPQITGEFLSFQTLLSTPENETINDRVLNVLAESLSPDDVATFIYTSGTTGTPKGAMLSHRALLHTGWAARQFVRIDENDVFLSFLPLCHVIERVGGHYLPISVGAKIFYSEGVFAIKNEMVEVRPTVFLCVPRLFESMQEAVLDKVSKAPMKRQRLFNRALKVGMACVERETNGEGAGLFLGFQRTIFDKLVYSKLRQRLVGGKARFFVSGGAPLNTGTAKFFEAIGLTILEGYGLTEIPVTNVNQPKRHKIGTVGPPLSGIEIMIANDGEVYARGPSRMSGYFGQPEATKEAIDAEGWFHTGDIGELTPEGYLRITDRKKDIIVLANGKNVAPQPIEAMLKQSTFINEAVLIGDKHSTVVALIVPSMDRLKSWAKDHDLSATAIDDLMSSLVIKKLIKEEIEKFSKALADFEKVKRFALISEPFTIESGELTPTLKVKRKFITQKYASVIETLVK